MSHEAVFLTGESAKLRLTSCLSSKDLSNGISACRDEMFIVPASPTYLLAPAERNDLNTITGNIALRWSVGRAHNRFL
jgi:hypothetical protein